MITTELKERPILFSGPMVRAILDGTKTQTRRVVKNHPGCDFEIGQYHRAMTDRHGEQYPEGEKSFGIFAHDGSWSIQCPYGQPSDRLWVRETWAPCRLLKRGEKPTRDMGTQYLVDDKQKDQEHQFIGRWIPSIHMPRWASRITLEITGVRVERLNDISHHDALQEGLIEWSDPPRVATLHYGLNRADCWETSAPAAYKRLWESINGTDSWALNPWVWVVEFKVL